MCLYGKLDVLTYGGVRGQTILAGDHLRVGGRGLGGSSTLHRRLLLLRAEVRLGLRGDGDQPRDPRPPAVPALALGRREHAGSGQLVPG